MKKILTSLLVGALALAGCGGGGEDEPLNVATPQAAEPDRVAFTLANGSHVMQPGALIAPDVVPPDLMAKLEKQRPDLFGEAASAEADEQFMQRAQSALTAAAPADGPFVYSASHIAAFPSAQATALARGSACAYSHNIRFTDKALYEALKQDARSNNWNVDNMLFRKQGYFAAGMPTELAGALAGFNDATMTFSIHQPVSDREACAQITQGNFDLSGGRAQALSAMHRQAWGAPPAGWQRNLALLAIWTATRVTGLGVFFAVTWNPTIANVASNCLASGVTAFVNARWQGSPWWSGMAQGVLACTFSAVSTRYWSVITNAARSLGNAVVNRIANWIWSDIEVGLANAFSRF